MVFVRLNFISGLKVKQFRGYTIIFLFLILHLSTFFIPFIASAATKKEASPAPQATLLLKTKMCKEFDSGGEVIKKAKPINYGWFETMLLFLFGVKKPS